MRANTTALRALAVLALVCLACGGPKTGQRQFVAGPLSGERLVDAASAAGFAASEMTADIPAARRPPVPFTFIGYGDSLLAELRTRYALEQVVAAGKDEWERQLLLKHWINGKIVNGNPTVPGEDAIEILEQAGRGYKFYCSHFALTYLQCAQALGWQARKLGVDRWHDREGMGSSHHGVAEVWSNRFRKWVVIDPQSDLHFEKGGLPLSAWEIRAEWLRNKGAEVEHVVGAPVERKLRNPAIVWWDRPQEDETACYFWIYYGDNAKNWDEEGACRFLFPQDSANAGKTWYQNDPATKNGQPHTGYRKNLFLNIPDPASLDWTVGVVEATLASASRGRITLSLDSWCPNLESYEVRLGGGEWRKAPDSAVVDWTLAPGENTLGLRTRNLAGVTGPEVALRLKLEQ